MALLRYAAKFDPFLTLDCARVEGVGQSKERKGLNFAFWQPCLPTFSPKYVIMPSRSVRYSASGRKKECRSVMWMTLPSRSLELWEQKMHSLDGTVE